MPLATLYTCVYLLSTIANRATGNTVTAFKFTEKGIGLINCACVLSFGSDSLCSHHRKGVGQRHAWARHAPREDSILGIAAKPKVPSD